VVAEGGVGDDQEGEGVEGEEGAEIAEEMGEVLGLVGTGGEEVLWDAGQGLCEKNEGRVKGDESKERVLRALLLSAVTGEDKEGEEAADDDGHDAERQAGAKMEMQGDGDGAADEGHAGHGLKVEAVAVGSERSHVGGVCGYRGMVIGVWLSGYGYRGMVIGVWLSGYGYRGMVIGVWLSG
jgi:hypothetical protein